MRNRMGFPFVHTCQKHQNPLLSPSPGKMEWQVFLSRISAFRSVSAAVLDSQRWSRAVDIIYPFELGSDAFLLYNRTN